jgi:hypothetical protein
MPALELDKLTQAVSDPEGWVETATSGDASATDVAAGPNGAEDTDTRSATEISGAGTSSGLDESDHALHQLDGMDALDQATTDVSQFSPVTIDVNGRPVEIPVGCRNLSECLPLFPDFVLPGNVTTIDQLTALAATGLQTAVYQQSNLGLTDGGTYDFRLSVDLGARNGLLEIQNLQSRNLGLSEAGFEGLTDFSSLPSGFNLPIGFAANAQLFGSSESPCDSGCDATAVAQLMNGNGRIADSVLQAVVIVPPATVSNPPPTPVVTATPDLVIRRP